MVEPTNETQAEHAGIHATLSLRAATTRHHHTDRVSGDTHHLIYLLSPVKGREVREQRMLQTRMALRTIAQSHTVQLACKQNT